MRCRKVSETSARGWTTWYKLYKTEKSSGSQMEAEPDILSNLMSLDMFQTCKSSHITPFNM